MAAASPKIVRFDEVAVVYEEEEPSDNETDSDYDEGVDTGTYFEPSLIPPIGYLGSPFDLVCQIVEGIYGHGSGLTEALVGREASFEVDTSASPGRELLVTVKDSQDNDVNCDVTSQGQSVYVVTYTPERPGSHSIEVLYDGINIQSSPFTVDVRKPRVYVEEFPACAYVGKPAMFKLDAAEMKKGTLEIDSSVEVTAYDKLSQNTYRITVVPKRAGSHDVIIKYNGEEIEGCPFQLEVKASTKRGRSSH